MTKSASTRPDAVSTAKPPLRRRTAVTASPVRSVMFGRCSAKRSTSSTLFAALESGYTRPDSSVTVSSPRARNHASVSSGGKAASVASAKPGVSLW